MGRLWPGERDRRMALEISNTDGLKERVPPSANIYWAPTYKGIGLRARGKRKVKRKVKRALQARQFYMN